MGHKTQFIYADSFSDGINRSTLAFLTQVLAPDTHSPTLAHHNNSAKYDPNTGLATAATDQNGNTTNFTYDLLLRPLQLSFPGGGQTNFSYPSTTQSVVQTKIDSTRSTYSTNLLDGYGRLSRTAVANAESTPYDLVDTCYDSYGRPKFTSYPYQAAGFTGSSVCSGAGDTMAYDAASRAAQLMHSDSSKTQYTYNGRAAQITDEGNGTFSVSRIQQSDGLGRLTAVCEVSSATLLGNGGTPSSCGLDISATGFLTSYAYDTLNNLTTVTQGTLATRTFSFDSLSRMISESEPEWGSGPTMSYTYNNDGLLTQRTRPAPNQTNPAVTLTTTYACDELHRLRSKSYSDRTLTPNTTYNYDETTPEGLTAQNTNGRLSSEESLTTTSALAKSAFSYDVVGRVLNNWQCDPQTCASNGFYQLGYQYDLSGDVTSFSNGTFVTLNYTYNSAPRLTGITSSLSDANHPPTLLSNVHYNQFGAATDTLGNGLNEAMGYSPRGIPQSYSSTPYSFSLGLAPNGGVISGNDSINGNWTYGYDQFNRVVSSNKNAGVQTFSYVYDRYGNRLQQNAPQGGPAPQYLFDNNNRIVGSGVIYDALGNVTNDGFHAYSYDGENRVSQVDGGATVTYRYDAEGRRVEGLNLEFIYDLANRPIDLLNRGDGSLARGEIYAGNRHVATYSAGTTNFMHVDWLGTKRAMTGVSGANSQTCTGLPFADGVSCTGSNWNYNNFGDDIHDNETNLEQTLFRQLSGTEGRWTTPDPFRGSMDPGDPQSLNRYTYVMNRPMVAVDPLGLYQAGPCFMCGTDNSSAFEDQGNRAFYGGLYWDLPGKGEYGSIGEQSESNYQADLNHYVSVPVDPLPHPNAFADGAPNEPKVSINLHVYCQSLFDIFDCVLASDSRAYVYDPFRHIYPGLADGDVPAGSLTQGPHSIFQGNRGLWAGSSDTAEDLAIATALVPVFVASAGTVGPPALAYGTAGLRAAGTYAYYVLPASAAGRFAVNMLLNMKSGVLPEVNKRLGSYFGRESLIP
jgi:RHS repeat-associated protein